MTRRGGPMQERVSRERVERIGGDAARGEVESGRALLVCAYDDESKWRQMRLENAVSLHDLQRGVGGVPRNQAVIFYCACPHEATPAGQAARFQSAGFRNAKALGGGVRAWQEAGYPMAA